jgi:hypothetical protein
MELSATRSRSETAVQEEGGGCGAGERGWVRCRRVQCAAGRRALTHQSRRQSCCARRRGCPCGGGRRAASGPGSCIARCGHHVAPSPPGAPRLQLRVQRGALQDFVNACARTGHALLSAPTKSSRYVSMPLLSAPVSPRSCQLPAWLPAVAGGQACRRSGPALRTHRLDGEALEVRRGRGRRQAAADGAATQARSGSPVCPAVAAQAGGLRGERHPHRGGERRAIGSLGELIR